MIRVYIMIALVVGASVAGWTGRDWYQSHLDKQAAEKQEEYRKGEASIALKVQQQIEEFSKNGRIIERHTREVLKRTVYSVECVDNDGMRIINAYATGRAADLAEEMPGAVAQDPKENR